MLYRSAAKKVASSVSLAKGENTKTDHIQIKQAIIKRGHEAYVSLEEVVTQNLEGPSLLGVVR